jgi:hypothetical protein
MTSSPFVPLSVLGAASLAVWMSSFSNTAARADGVAAGVSPRGTSLGQFLSDPALLRRLSSSSSFSAATASAASVSAKTQQEEMLTL